MKTRIRITALAVAGVVAASLGMTGVASASTGVSNDFNTPGTLASDFNSYIGAGSITQEPTGGLSDSGAIHAGNGTTNAIFASKTSYSLGPVGASYTFGAFMHNVGGSGYSGMGFTTLLPSAGNTSANDFHPTDALGVYVHGGGFYFTNAGTDFSGSWSGGSDGAITEVTPFSGSDDMLVSGNWYKTSLVITRTSVSTFSMRLSVWSSDAAGNLSPADPIAVFELNGQPSPDLLASPTIASYFNFSGDRIHDFDNFSVDLAGGASIVAPGAPVVLTGAVSDASNVVTLDGEVTSIGDSAVTERGFVYGTSSEPTTADSTVVVGSGIGAFSGSTPSLAAGTYFFRAYATNTQGTTYGSEQTITLETLPNPVVTPAESLASTGVDGGLVTALGGAVALLIATGAALVAYRRKNA